MEFSRQEYWGEFPFSSTGELPDPGIKPIPLTAPQVYLKNLKSEIKQNIKVLYWVKVSLRGLSTRCQQEEGARKVLQLKERSCISYMSHNHWMLTASTAGPPGPYPLGMISNSFLLFLPLPGWGIWLSCSIISERYSLRRTGRWWIPATFASLLGAVTLPLTMTHTKGKSHDRKHALLF